jgi:DNA polymerase I-like protein with 3'-5' exonuclease and polymerase domains
VDVITIDMETYYDPVYSLSKITTEEYVRHPMFEVIGVAVKVNNGPTEWASGTHEELKTWLRTNFKWQDAFVLAHNTMFDGAILSWKFGITAKAWLDTMSMARALHGPSQRVSLKSLAEKYNAGVKGTEVVNALGKHRRNFSTAELAKYGDYCINDVELTHNIFHQMIDAKFPRQELKVIDIILRMFIEPVLELDSAMLKSHLHDVQARKELLLLSCCANRDDLMSNPKFAELLRQHGVEPPMKVSPATGQQTFAFAKTDEAFKALTEHPKPEVQMLVAARLGNKSTLEETRTQRFINIASRGLLPVPLRNYAAHTGRLGGDDKINMQNLPSRGQNANKLKKAIRAPEGYVLIDTDSSQIEARTLAWLAGQDDLVEAFAEGKDVYSIMAASIYGVDVPEVTKEQRFVGKTTILGCGYGMGAPKFQAQLLSFGVSITLDEARRIIDIYRSKNSRIVALWRQAQNLLVALSRGERAPLGRAGVLTTVPKERAIRLPSGLLMRYDGLRFIETEKGVEFVYDTRTGPSRIYGGKCVENVCQALATIIIKHQMVQIDKQHRLVLQVHDAIAAMVREDEVDDARAFIETCMRTPPEWAAGLPLNCESGVGKTYGDC